MSVASGHLRRRRRASFARPSFASNAVERLRLRDRAREAVEDEAALARRGWPRRSSTRPMTTSSGTSSPASMYSSAFLPSGRALATGGAQHVARRDLRDAEAHRRAAAPACPCRRPARPRRMRLRSSTGSSRALPRRARPRMRGPFGPGEAFVVARDEVRLDLLHRVERDADDDRAGRCRRTRTAPGTYCCMNAGSTQTADDVERAAEA